VHVGEDGKKYKPTAEYQAILTQLTSRYTYWGDTNFAKMDRIVHPGIKDFKRRVLGTTIHGLTVVQWSRLLFRGSDDAIRHALQERFDIREEDIGKILE
jgi:hypothetical protein